MNKTEYVARKICAAKGFNPDNKMYYTSSGTIAMPPTTQWQDDHYLRWEDFEYEAKAAIKAVNNWNRKKK